MCDEAVLGLLESDNNTPEIRYAAFKSVGAAVSRAEQQYRGRGLSGNLLSSLKPGLPDFASRISFKQATDDSQMQDLLSQIAKATNGAEQLPLRAFKAIFDGKDKAGKDLACGSHIAKRLFMAISPDGKLVSTKALASMLLVLHCGGLSQRTALLWALLCNKDGRLRLTEFKEMLQACGIDAHLRIGEEAALLMATAFFRKAGKPDSGDLTFEDFASVLKDQPEMLRSLHIANVMCAAGEKPGDSRLMATLPFWERQQDRMLRLLDVEDLRFAAWMSFFMLCQAAGFAAVLVQYLCIDSGQPAYAVAKGSAQSIQGPLKAQMGRGYLYLDSLSLYCILGIIVMALLLFSVCRNLLTLLRATPLQQLLPLDEHLKTHAWLAAQLLFWSILHGTAHIIRNQRNPVTRQGGHDVPSTSAAVYKQATPITGILLAVVMFAGYLFAGLRPGSKEGGKKPPPALRSFHTFQISHAVMAVLWIVLLILHPLPGSAVRNAVPRASTWVYLLPSLVVYGAERLWRFSRATSRLIQVDMVRLLPDDVVELRMQRPAGWLYSQQAGQYAYIMVPKISCWDWHPFTISSAPSDSFISFHIKACGGWTKTLCTLAQQGIAQRHAAPDLEASQPSSMRPEMPHCLRPDIKVAVDGPFGAPSQDQKLHDVVVLVGGGVAVTPFLSILKQLVREYENSRCTRCQKPNRRICPLRHVYFHWTVREQASPRYLEQVLKRMVSKDYKDFISINIHLTPALQDNDLRACIARMAQRLLHAEEGYDAVAGATMPLPLSFGRPSWAQVLSDVMVRHSGCKIGVFVCAPQNMISNIKSVCNALNMQEASAAAGTQLLFRHERF